MFSLAHPSCSRTRALFSAGTNCLASRPKYTHSGSRRHWPVSARRLQTDWLTPSGRSTRASVAPSRRHRAGMRSGYTNTSLPTANAATGRPSARPTTTAASASGSMETPKTRSKGLFTMPFPRRRQQRASHRAALEPAKTEAGRTNVGHRTSLQSAGRSQRIRRPVAAPARNSRCNGQGVHGRPTRKPHSMPCGRRSCASRQMNAPYCPEHLVGNMWLIVRIRSVFIYVMLWRGQQCSASFGSSSVASSCGSTWPQPRRSAARTKARKTQ